jgi:hypothetical protein
VGPVNDDVSPTADQAGRVGGVPAGTPPVAGASAELVPVGVDRLPAERVPVGELVDQAGQTALGFALLVGDGVRAVARQVVGPAALPEPVDDAPGPFTASRRVALGLAVGVQRRALDATEVTVNAVAPTVRWLVSSPLLRPATAPVRDRLAGAYDAGLERERSARRLATRTGEETVAMAVPVVLGTVELQPIIDQVLNELDLGPVVTRVIDQIDLKPVVGKVIGDLDLKPIIERVLADLDLPVLVDDVMADLDLDPIVTRVIDQLDLAALVNDVVGEIQMSSVVMQATGGITDDIVGGVRDRSADADALVERIVAKVLRRRAAALPPAAFPEAPTAHLEEGS